MKLAFWKRKRSRRSSPDLAGANVDPALDEVAEGADAATAAARVRVRTRRQLIGAFALLLAVVILVPMLLDPTPRAVPGNIPIDLPSDRTPFAPRLAAPVPAPPAPAAAPSAAADSAAGVPAAPGSAADTAVDAAPAGPPAAGGASKEAEEPASAGKKHSTPSGESTKGEAKHTAHKSDASAAGQGKIFVQAAAMSSESAAQKLAGRLAKSGLEPFVERTDTGDGVWYRVRLGPFASREDAERSLERLRALRVNANIVGA